MTKRVPVPGKAKRAGGGERPVRVKEWGKSLLSSQNQRQPVVLNGTPPLEGDHIIPGVEDINHRYGNV